MSLSSDANFFPFTTMRDERGDSMLRHFFVGDLIVPIVECKADLAGISTGADGEPDETGNLLWASSTLVSSLLLRCRSLLGATDVLEFGCGSGFCGLVARQIARSVVFSDREPRMRRLTRRNLDLQPFKHLAPSNVEAYGWAKGDAWPAGKFGLVIASDVLYGPHESMRTSPEELSRFVEMLESALACGGMAIVAYVERNCLGLADLRGALSRRFSVRQMSSEACVSAALHSQPGNAGVRASVVLLCTRLGEAMEAADLLLMASEHELGQAAMIDVSDYDGGGHGGSGGSAPKHLNARCDRRDDEVAMTCGLDVRRLCWLEVSPI